jgi:predicted small secreted protein
MKKLAIAALASTFVLAGCSTMGLDNERDMVVEGQAVSVKVVNIPSFEVEIAPRKALCEMMDTSGNTVEAQCLQYRQTYQKNYNTLNGNIQGFTYEPNYRYILDVRQEAIADTTSGMVKPVWLLNEVVSKTAE